MVNVAVAGGTSPTLGKSITQAILATGKHNVSILTRAASSEQTTTPSTTSSQPEPEATSTQQNKYGAPLIPVHYTSLLSLTTTLRHHKIHTLISLLKPLPTPTDSNPSLTIHSTLLEACQSAECPRFIMSDWSLAPASHKHVDLLAHKFDLHHLGERHMHESSEAGGSTVECCSIQVGGFMEYSVQGCHDPDGNLSAGLHDDLMLRYINIANNHLIIPCRDDGTPAKISMTSVHDIGVYVAAALDLPRGKLTGYIGIVGDMFSYDEVLDILNGLGRQTTPVYMRREEFLEEAERCQRDFERKIERGEGVDVGLVMGRMAAQMMGCLCGEIDGGGIVGRNVGSTADNGMVLLNEMFPEIRTVKIEELLRRAWGGKRTNNGS